MDCLFRVTADGGDQLFGAALPLGGFEAGRCDMLAQMGLDDFVHESVHGAPDRSDLLQDGRAIHLLLQCPFDGGELARDPSDPAR